MRRHLDTLAGLLTIWAGHAHQCGAAAWLPLALAAVACWAAHRG